MRRPSHMTFSACLLCLVAHGAIAAGPPARPADSPATAPVAAAVPLPADAAGATAALVASPRHGEWVDVAISAATEPDPASTPTAPAPIRTWVSYPERADKAPVVIVVHEIFGLTDWVRAVADQLAAEGFIAVAPDLLSGKGPNGGGTESFTGDAVRGAIRGLDRAEVTQRLDAVRRYAIGLPSARPAVACTGFCWGGSTTFAYACDQPELKAALVWYGTAPSDEAGLARITCPVVGMYGGDDARVTATVEPTAARMKAAGKTYTTHVFPGAGHGFLRQQTGRDGANLSAAQTAWAEAVTLLRARLEPAAGS